MKTKNNHQYWTVKYAKTIKVSIKLVPDINICVYIGNWRRHIEIEIEKKKAMHWNRNHQEKKGEPQLKELTLKLHRTKDQYAAFTTDN